MVWRALGAPHRQNSQLCAATVEGNPLLVADQNGGLACGYQRTFAISVPPAGLRSAQHAAAQPEYLCTAVLHGQWSHMPHFGRFDAFAG
jgi:hypothetical protein